MGAVTITILGEGKPMDPRYEVLSLDVIREVNRIPYAQLVLNDGLAAKANFPISDAAFFAPGKAIEVKLRYEGTPASEGTVLKGLVVTHRVEASPGVSLLTLELKDAAVKMTRVRTHQVYVEQTDKAVIEKLIKKHGLETGSLTETTLKHKELLQYGCTDWDFLLARADSSGLLVDVHEGRVSAVRPALEGGPDWSFRYGTDEIYELELEADAGGQVGNVQSLAWDVGTQEMTGAEAKDVSLAPGNLNAGTLAEALGALTVTLTSLAPLAMKELKAWADAELARSRLGLIRGRLSVRGAAGIKPLQRIAIQGVGERFNGTALATGVRHRVSSQGWITDVQVGLSPGAHASHSDVSAAPAAGLLPAVSGLQIGVVAAFEEDPEKRLRVKVRLPALGVKQTVWARVAMPEAGGKGGLVFWPEPGDEVVIGFFDDDPRSPVILGGLYSQQNPPGKPFSAPTEQNAAKGLVTRTGLRLALDDEKKTLSIKTPSANQILLDDEAEKIQISDQHGNTITLSQDGIVMKSAKDLVLEAGGNVTLQGAKVDIQ